MLACGSQSSEGGLFGPGGALGNNGGKGQGDGDAGGTGNGNADGDGDGSGSGNGSGPPLGCGERGIRPGRVTPDMLVVLDRSTSMDLNGVNRWDPSVSGLNAIVGDTEDSIRFGLMTYPARSRSGGGFGGGSSCAPGELDVPIALNNAGPIADMLDMTSPGGYTPTAATLESVHDILTVQWNDGAPVDPQYVLLITDGAPNCHNGSGIGGGGSGLDPAAVDATVAAVEALAKAGIATYVLGYDTKNNAELSAALDRMAKAGNTGDTAHRPIEDEASLKQEFAEITGTAISCEYRLSEEATAPEYVRIAIDGRDVPQNETNGWSLSEDGTRVTLHGEPCELLKSGGVRELSVAVECEEVIVDLW